MSNYIIIVFYVFINSSTYTTLRDVLLINDTAQEFTSCLGLFQVIEDGENCLFVLPDVLTRCRAGILYILYASFRKVRFTVLFALDKLFTGEKLSIWSFYLKR